MQLLINRFGIQSIPNLYYKLRHYDHSVNKSLWLSVHSFYDVHERTWERKIYYVHVINNVRVMQNRIHEIPKADNRLSAKGIYDVIACVYRVLKDNEHIHLDSRYKDFLTLSLVNYFLRQINYPMVIGTDIIKNGLSKETLHSDIIAALEIWNAFSLV